MTTWDSQYLLNRFNRLAGRPSTDALTDTVKYTLLSDAQNQIVADMAGIYPQAFYPAVGYPNTPQLQTTDSQTFTFGTDTFGNPLAPIGKVAIYQSLNDIPDYPWRAGRDYVVLGNTAIQLPNQQTWSGPLYWRGISPPGDISKTAQPILYPEASRELIVIRAVHNYAQEGMRNIPLADQMAQRYGWPLASNTGGQFPMWCQTWKTSYRQGGAMGSMTGLAVAIGSSTNLSNSF